MLFSGKETVVKRPDAAWSFTLPERHDIYVRDDVVLLATPDASSTFQLDGVEETDDEVIVRLGDELFHMGPPAGSIGDPRGYPLPEIHEERARLQARWRAAGLGDPEFDASTAGGSGDDDLRDIRRRLRDAERR